MHCVNSGIEINSSTKYPLFSTVNVSFKDVLLLCMMIIYSQILSAMEISGSLVLLELLISIMCREAQHVYEDEIQNSIVRFIKR